MEVPLFSPSIAAARRMKIHAISVVNAAAIISVITILLTGLYASDMTSFERVRIDVDAEIGSKVTAIRNSNISDASLLPPLSNTMGAWFDLATYTDAKAVLECNISKSAEPENCCSKHHILLATQQQFRIRTGDGSTTVNPRNSVDLLRLAANKRITFLGDSMTNQVFETLYKNMDHLGIRIVEDDLRHRFPDDDGGEGLEIWWRRFHVPMFNSTVQCTMMYKYHYREEEFRMTASTANYTLTGEDKVVDPFPMNDGMVTRREQMQWILDQSDIVVFQIGYHYQPEYSLDGIRRNDDTAKVFKPTIHLLFAWFHDIRKDTGKRFIIRDILPVNKRDLLHGQICSQASLNYSVENAVLEKQSMKYGFPFVRTEHFYADKGHAKVGLRQESKKIDCLHYCMNQFIYAPVINALYEAMYFDLFS
ncbi:hypothetical protein HDU80_011311 [Chytriomyces hyalinus]|nr:hypothetical protein HDU80_011311 [Chytriomyces hyalinus]